MNTSTWPADRSGPQDRVSRVLVWILVAVTIACSIGMLAATRTTYQQAAPIPQLMTAADGTPVLTYVDIVAGKSGFQKADLMDYGSLYGMGSSFGEDYTAEYLVQLAQEVQKQKQVMQATIDAQEKERKEIGKELHDNINQHLTTTRLYLEVALEKTGEGEGREMMQHAHRELTEIIRKLRNVSQTLVPPTLGDIGLVESVEDICNSLRRTLHCEVEFSHRSFSDDHIEDNLKLMLFRIIQEQLNNIVKHAAATKIHINLRADAELIELDIEDNGRGFEPGNQPRKGLGFTNIANRAGLFNGQVEIDAAPGRGCRLSVRIPLR